MTKDDVITLAMEASGAEINGYRYGPNGKEPLYGVPVGTEDGFEYQRFEVPPWFERFAALVAAAERSAILRAIDEIDEPPYTGYENPNTFDDGCIAVADAIRARSAMP